MGDERVQGTVTALSGVLSGMSLLLSIRTAKSAGGKVARWQHRLCTTSLSFPKAELMTNQIWFHCADPVTAEFTMSSGKNSWGKGGQNLYEIYSI